MVAVVVITILFQSAVLISFQGAKRCKGHSDASHLVKPKASWAGGREGQRRWGAVGGREQPSLLWLQGKRGQDPAGPLAPELAAAAALSLCPIFLSHIWWLCSSRMTQSKQSSNPLLRLLPVQIRHFTKTQAAPRRGGGGGGAVPQTTGDPRRPPTVQETHAGASGLQRYLFVQPISY